MVAILGILALGRPGLAQPPAPYNVEDRVIGRDGVEVRSGPSPRYYPTSKVSRGFVVKVVKAYSPAPGWLAILPPRGSFSWIDARFISQMDGHSGQVIAEDVPVLIGSSLTKDAPSVRLIKLRRGTQVVILGPPLVASDKSQWLPIEPHITEVRYIPADVVQNANPDQTVVAKPPAAPALQPVPGAAHPAPGGDSQNPLWIQAQRAEAAGQGTEAAKLYQQLLAQPTTDPALKLQCQNRLASLTPPSPAAGSGPVQLTSMAPKQPASVGLSGTLVPPPVNPATALYPPPSVNPAAPGQTSSAAAAPATTSEQWIGPGWLRTACFQLQGNQVYAFSDKQMNLLCYVVAGPGVSLDRYLSRWVHLSGARSYRTDADVRYEYLIVNQVRPVQ
jgi:hypothetical protein